MPKFELSASFLIGHKAIDGEHAELIDILNEMNERYLSQNLCECEQQWKLFCQKLEAHHINEEKIMEEFDYVFDSHKKVHREILEHVINVGKKCKTLADWEEYFYMVRSEFLAQILKHDIYFARHLTRIGYK